MSSFIEKLVLDIVPLAIAIVLHELSHGYVAYALGDNTAKKANRLNLYNHFDPYGSFLIPLVMYLLNSPFLLGYAKPVPVNPRNFKNPMQDMALVAIAGPLCNFILAVFASFWLNGQHITGADLSIVQQSVLNFITINLALFFFNLIPIPPLDGSRIVANFLPPEALRIFYRIEPVGFMLVMAIEFLSRNFFMMFRSQASLLHTFVHKPVMATLELLLH